MNDIIVLMCMLSHLPLFTLWSWMYGCIARFRLRLYLVVAEESLRSLESSILDYVSYIYRLTANHRHIGPRTAGTGRSPAREGWLRGKRCSFPMRGSRFQANARCPL
jgi:hypothetical protein